MIYENVIVGIFRSIGVIVENSHFVYTSGFHGSEYINKDVLFQRPALSSDVCKILAEKFLDLEINVVIAPAYGGIALSNWLAYHLASLQNDREVLSFYTERKEHIVVSSQFEDAQVVNGMAIEEGSQSPSTPISIVINQGEQLIIKEKRFILRRGANNIEGKRVLVGDDILTTGSSAREVVRVIRDLGGDVVGVGALWNRGGVTEADLGDVPMLHSLVNRKLPTWSAEECAMRGPCSQGVPVNLDVGKGFFRI